MACIMHRYRFVWLARRGTRLMLAVLLLSAALMSACGAAETGVRRTDTSLVPATQTPDTGFSSAVSGSAQQSSLTVQPTRQASPTVRMPAARSTREPTATLRTDPSPTARPTRTPRPTVTRAPQATAIPRSVDGLRTIAFDDLPREARRTIQLIESGGPFPYRQDGSTFQNRERLLPRKAGGYYREYTVVTPGEDDRGARRIIAGEEGELYYTDDHYDSFRRVIR